MHIASLASRIEMQLFNQNLYEIKNDNHKIGNFLITKMVKNSSGHLENRLLIDENSGEGEICCS